MQRLLPVLRRIGAVLAGLLATAILSKGMDAILRATGIFPPWGPVMMDQYLLALSAAYRSVFVFAGGHLTARLASDQPARYALVLGVVQAMFDVGVAVTWEQGGQFLPQWYPIVLIFLAIPCAWAGGKLFVAQLRARPLQP